MKTITIDYEFNAETFWAAARESAEGENAELLERLDCAEDEITVPDDVAELFLSWCRTVPGFSGGPDHARSALIVRDEKIFRK